MFIHTGQILVADIGSKKTLLFHIKRLCQEQGKNYKGFTKMPVRQLKAIFLKMWITSLDKKNKKSIMEV